MYSLMLSMNDILKIKTKIIWLLHNIDCMREKKKLVTNASLRKRKTEANVLPTRQWILALHRCWRCATLVPQKSTREKL